jgi:hypothetical protein
MISASCQISTKLFKKNVKKAKNVAVTPLLSITYTFQMQSGTSLEQGGTNCRERRHPCLREPKVKTDVEPDGA